MIARIWTGYVPNEKSRAYLDLMARVAIPEYLATAGNRGAWCLHRTEDARTRVTMLSFWESFDAISGFAGADIEKARYYDFDPDYLIDMPARVAHFEVFGRAPA